MPTRVLFVDHETRLSGAERNMVDLIEQFDPARVEVHLVVPEDGPLARAATSVGAEVHLLALTPGLLSVSRWGLARNPLIVLRHAVAIVRAIIDLDRLVRRLKPDLLHSNSQKAHLLTAPVGIVRRVPHVWHQQDIINKGWLAGVAGCAARLSAARLICLSEATARPFRGGALDDRVRVVYSGVRQLAAAPHAAAAFRQSIGATDGVAVVGIVGQIARWKGQDIFIEAAALLAAERPDTRFAIVGACLFPENEAAFEARIRKRVAELGLGDRFAFTGPLDPIEPVMAGLDVFVHCSRLPEPFGRVIVEAMAQGTPVVTTTVGAGPELVPRGAGRCVPPEDPVALARAVAELLDARTLTVARSLARQAAGRFTIDATRVGVEAVYAELGL
jgi:glycosyltransferase involved in cell wall biosynthesis